MNQSLKKTLYNYIYIFMVAAIMPLLVYVHIYHFNCEDVEWFDKNALCSDLFSYGKSIFFQIISLLMLWRLLSEKLISRKQEAQKKINKSIYILFLFGIFEILSVFFAINKKMAIWGGYQRFEGTFVLIGYIILFLYVYKISRLQGAHEFIVIPLAASSIIMSIFGFIQILYKDPFTLNKFLYFVLPFGKKMDFESTLKIKKAYMTLANPNTASLYLSMLIPLLFMAVLTYKGWKKYLCIISLIFSSINLIFTASRVGIIALVPVALLGLIMCRKLIRPNLKRILLIFAAIILFFILSDIVMRKTSISLLSRFSGSSSSEDKMNFDLQTKKDGIHIKKNKTEYVLSFSEKEDFYSSLKIKDNSKKDISDKVFDYESGTFKTSDFDGITITEGDVDDETFLAILYDNQNFLFTHDEYGGYLFYTGSDTYGKITNVKYTDLHGFETFASNRGYIWSRTLPLLKKYGLFGCGADNFVLAFPQNDYMGKFKYCQSSLTVVEKPHNVYLEIALQNGIPALLLITLFYIMYSTCVVRFLKNNTKENLILVGAFLGSIAFVLGGFVNDSSINVTPLFFILTAMSLGGLEKTH